MTSSKIPLRIARSREDFTIFQSDDVATPTGFIHQKKRKPSAFQNQLSILSKVSHESMNFSKLHQDLATLRRRSRKTSTSFLPIMNNMGSPQKKARSSIGIIPEDYFPEKHNFMGKANPAAGPTSRESMNKEILNLVMDEEEEGRQAMSSSNFKYIISPSGVFYQGWKSLIILVSFVSVFFYAFAAAFQVQLEPWNDDSHAPFAVIHALFQFIFFVDMVINFFTEYVSSRTGKVERRLKHIAQIYLKGDFLLDFITLFPFCAVFYAITEVRPSRAGLFYLIKLLRLVVCFQRLSYKSYVKYIKAFFHQRMLLLIEQNKELADDQTVDNNHISLILTISNCLKTIYLIAYILCGSVITGLVWYTFCFVSSDDGTSDNFITYFALEERQSNMELAGLVTYFAFTSLSTVGLGDFHPRSNAERMLGAFLLLFGVAMTSYIMDNFNLMIFKMREFNKEFDENDRLAQFLGTIERFNNDIQLPSKLALEFEKYFGYRWKYHKNNVLSTVLDKEIYGQLPLVVQKAIYSDFLYKDFMQTYKKYFEIMMEMNRNELDFKIAHDPHLPGHVKSPEEIERLKRSIEQDVEENLQDFLIIILKYLEPMLLGERTLIFGQRQDPGQILFLMGGRIEVGYNQEFSEFQHTIQENLQNKDGGKKHDRGSSKRVYNHIIKSFRAGTKRFKAEEQAQKYVQKKKFVYPLSFEPGQIVGIYEIVFNKKSHFIYKTGRTPCDTFFIRRRNWRQVVKETEELPTTLMSFKKSVLSDYVDKVYLPIQRYSDKVFKMQKDYQFKKKKSQFLKNNITQRKTLKTQKSMKKKKIELEVAEESSLQSESGSDLECGVQPAVDKDGMGEEYQKQISKNLSKDIALNLFQSRLRNQITQKLTKSTVVHNFDLKDIQDINLKNLVENIFSKEDEKPKDQGETSSVDSSATDLEDLETFNQKIRRLFDSLNVLQVQVLNLVNTNTSLNHQLRIERTKNQMLESKLLNRRQDGPSNEEVNSIMNTPAADDIDEEDGLFHSIQETTKIGHERINLYLPQTRKSNKSQNFSMEVYAHHHNDDALSVPSCIVEEPGEEVSPLPPSLHSSDNEQHPRGSINVDTDILPSQEVSPPVVLAPTLQVEPKKKKITLRLKSTNEAIYRQADPIIERVKEEDSSSESSGSKSPGKPLGLLVKPKLPPQNKRMSALPVLQPSQQLSLLGLSTPQHETRGLNPEAPEGADQPRKSLNLGFFKPVKIEIDRRKLKQPSSSRHLVSPPLIGIQGTPDYSRNNEDHHQSLNSYSPNNFQENINVSVCSQSVQDKSAESPRSFSKLRGKEPGTFQLFVNPSGIEAPITKEEIDESPELPSYTRHLTVDNRQQRRRQATSSQIDEDIRGEEITSQGRSDVSKVSKIRMDTMLQQQLEEEKKQSELGSSQSSELNLVQHSNITPMASPSKRSSVRVVDLSLKRKSQ